MKFFRHQAKTDVTIYPIVCWHIGAPQSDARFIADTIQRIKDDPTARWIYLGDGGEVVTKQSKGDVYTQTMSPGAQISELVSLLEPIKAKGLFGIRGNHGHRIYKETGLDFDEQLMTRIGLPYLGTAAFMHLEAGRSSYDVYLHHGVDSGANIGTKSNAARKLGDLVAADAVITAHSHIAMPLPPRYVAKIDAQHGKIVYNEQLEYIAGSAYDSRVGYAEDKGYSPILPSHISVKFTSNRQHEKQQEFNLWRAKP